MKLALDRAERSERMGGVVCAPADDKPRSPLPEDVAAPSIAMTSIADANHQEEQMTKAPDDKTFRRYSMKSFWYAAVLAGVFLAPITNAEAQPAGADAPKGHPWDPGVADKQGRVINPVFRKEKDRPAPVDRGIDPDTIAPSTSHSSSAPPPPQVIVRPVPTRGSAVR